MEPVSELASWRCFMNLCDKVKTIDDIKGLIRAIRGSSIPSAQHEADFLQGWLDGAVKSPVTEEAN